MNVQFLLCWQYIHMGDVSWKDDVIIFYKWQLFITYWKNKNEINDHVVDMFEI